MAKRFTDTDKWKRQSFRELPFKAKLAFFYLCDQCDHTGVWPSDFPQMSFHLGYSVTESNLIEWFKDKIVKFDGNKFFLVTFFEFQYGDSKEGFRAKQSAIAKLQKLGLMDSNLEVSRQSMDSPWSVPNTPSIVECSVVECSVVNSSLEEGDDSKFDARALAAEWNSRMTNARTVAGKPIPLVDLSRFTAKQERHASAKARLEEESDRDRWIDVIDRIARAEFCRGRNQRNWVANFDFLVKPKTHIAVMEGQYGCTPRSPVYAPRIQSSSQTEASEPVVSTEQLAVIRERLRKAIGVGA